MFLQATMPAIQQQQAEEIQNQPAPKSINDLGLTRNISEVVKEDAIKKAEEKKTSSKKDLESVRSIVDSIVSLQTAPLLEEVNRLQNDLKESKEQVNEFQNLLAMVSGQSDSLDQAQAKRLSKMLEDMKPASAAAILKRLNSDVNAQLLLMMRQKSAAKIMAELPEERAATIAKHLSKGFTKSSI
ncbi:hypothetical protein K8I28_07095 [bacterium]|nr:hypothetical protein [bacterium]